jgi:hypothetical protein
MCSQGLGKARLNNLALSSFAETIAKIRERTKEAMNRPEIIAWLKLTHKPGQVAPDVRVWHLLSLLS